MYQIMQVYELLAIQPRCIVYHERSIQTFLKGESMGHLLGMCFAWQFFLFGTVHVLNSLKTSRSEFIQQFHLEMMSER